MKILFSGGGTGGHLLPIIAVSREIRKIYPKEKRLEFFYIGPKDEFGEVLLSQEGIKVKKIFAGKIRRYFNWKSVLENVFDIFLKFPLGLLQSFFYIFFLAPDVIFSKGGYGSLPTALSGWVLGVPIFLHESDVSPGLANKILSRFALEIFTSFPKTGYFSLKKMILVGNPIRKEILLGSKEEAKRIFELKGGKPLILVLGGSQGAQKINDTILNILPHLLKEFEVVHQTGEKNFAKVKAEAKVMITQDLEQYYHPFPFLKEVEIRHAYQACDLIVSRAGSGSIFEIAAVGKPSILIPLPTSAQNHQVKNAYAYSKEGGAVVVEEANLTPHFFLEKLKYLFSHPGEIQKMQECARDFSKPDAAHIIAEYMVEYLLI